MRKTIPIILMLALISVMIGGCVLIDNTSDDNGGTLTTAPMQTEPAMSDDTTTPKQTEAEPKTKPEETPEKSVFGVGESTEVNDVVVTLLDVRESMGSDFNVPSDGNVFIICEFEIQNNSKSELAISSLLSFETYIDDYATNLSLSAMIAADTTQLDGTVAPGKKMRGVVGYEAADDWKTIEVRFKSNVWLNKEHLFKYTK